MSSRRSTLLALARLASASALSALASRATSQTPRTAAAPRVVVGRGSTRIAIILEALSGPYGRASSAVFAGLKAGHARDGQDVSMELLEIGESDDDVAAAVRTAESRQAQLAIGPLTRNAVNALSDLPDLPLPVIALNQPDPDRRIPANLVSFGLPIEGEVLQVARAAFDDAALRVPERRPLRALVVANSSSIGRRSAAAFVEDWHALGGDVLPPVETDSRNAGEMRGTLADADAQVAFVAVDPDALRAVRSTLPRRIPIYGTSQLNAGISGPVPVPDEVEGVRLVEMPWQVEPDSVAVMAYPRQPALVHPELQRLYALGIDAFRVANELLAQHVVFQFDGVTGRLRADLASSARIDRRSVLAEYRGGVLVPIVRQ